jgi:predicted ribosome quality control (RQC) complex YloA/Tae2 family protein
LRQEILKQGFDAILVSKIVGAEDKVTLLQSYKDLDRLFNDFYDDYNFSQSVFSTAEEVQSYQVYHT